MKEDMKAPKATDVKRGISVIRENLQCPICLDLLSVPVSTKCDHQFCRFCMMKLLDRNKEAKCPVCKAKVTKRSLRESPGFQRLVEGLQQIVQAYEDDTSTDYLTGAGQRPEHPRCQKGGPGELQCNGGKPSSCDSQGVDSADSSLSQGPKEARNSLSSVEAKQGYAELMDLEDSCAVVFDKEGTNGGLPDKPPVSEMGADDKCIPSTTYLEMPVSSEELATPLEAEVSRTLRRTKKVKSHDASHEQCEGPEEVPKKMDRRPRRASTTEVGSESDKKIVDKRCRRSLQKVSEWLLKISPVDVEEDCDGCVSDGGSSSSTVKENNDEEQLLTLRREEQNKSLEEQVFGVVYRRDRKSMGNRLNKTLPLESGGVTVLPDCHPAEVIPIQNTASVRRTSSRLASAGLDKTRHTEEKVKEIRALSQPDCSDSTVEPIKGQMGEDIPKEDVEQPEYGSRGSYRKKVDQVELPEEVGVAGDSPVFEVSVRSTTKRARSNVGSTWKEVENLRQDGNRELGNAKLSKRKGECRKNENRLTQMRTAKVAKPLDLVSGGVDECDPAVRLEKVPLVVETEVQIESCPSSEGLGSLATRRTRQSKRLLAFTEAVQGIRKKTRLAESTKSVMSHSDKAHAVEKAEFEKMVVGAECQKRKKLENDVSRNGCIVDGELANIEKMESSFSEGTESQSKQKESPTKQSISLSAVPNLEQSSDVNIQCSAHKGVHPPSQSSQTHSQRDVVEIHSSVESCVHTVIEVHGEEDEKNDSEVDTEQLLKTFKATTRRSFQLGVPNNITSDRGSAFFNKQNREAVIVADFVNEEINPKKNLEPSCLMETVKHAEEQQNQETLSFGTQSPSISRKNEVANSLCSDVIPLSSLSNHNLHKSLSQKISQDMIGDDSKETFEGCLHSDIGKCSEAEPTENYDNETAPAGRKRTSSRMSVNSEMVESVLLFSALVGSEEGPKESASTIGNVPLGEMESQKPLNGTSEDLENSGVVYQGLVESGYPFRAVVQDSAHGSHGFHSGHQAMKLPYSGTDKVLESSVTPDDLLPPNVVASCHTECVVGAVPSERAQSVEVSTQWSSGGMLSLKKRKRPQRLPSSGSDSSDEEDQLPSIAQLFGQDESKQRADEKTIHLGGDLPLGQGQASTEVHVEGAPVVLKVAAGNTSSTSPAPEWVPASQGSVDLFDTPEECEGLPDDRVHSVESSQFSNEIIATQQKVAMQQELRRLEEMMALVSEALHKKADGSQARLTGGAASPQHPSSVAAQRGQDHHQSPQRCDHKGEAPTRSSPPSALSPISSPGARTLRSGRGFTPPLHAHGATPGPSPAQPGSAKDKGRVQEGRRCSRRGRSLKSSGTTGGNVAGIEAATPHGAVQTRAAAPASERMEGERLPAGRVRPSVTTAGRAHSDAVRGGTVLVASGLSAAELSVVKKFSRKIGGSLSAQVTPETTHVIMKTDENLVCERTLKYFLGIAARKWVLSFQWVVQCFNHGKVLDEAAFEVRGDVVNGQHHQGPMKARTTGDQRLLMGGYEVCFQGSFTDMSTGQMEWMAELCGAKVVKDPLLFTGEQESTRLVVLQPDSEDSRAGYAALQKKAAVVSRGWLLDSVSTYTLQNIDDYRV